MEGLTRGVLEEEGLLVTDLLGFEDPLCGLLHSKAVPFIRRREGGNIVLRECGGTLAPAPGSTGRAPAYPFMYHRPDVPCQGALGL